MHRTSKPMMFLLLAIGAAAAILVTRLAMPLITQVELETLDRRSEQERQRLEERVKSMPPVPEEAKKFGPRP